MSSIGKGIPIIASRRALERLSSKYPNHLLQIIKEKPKQDDTSWPIYMKRAGYAAIGLAIPYSLSVIISESPRLREMLEGDPGTTDSSFSMGRKIVEFVRWYWGRQDDIPYSEYVHNQHHNELSLPVGDVSFVKRREQQMIQDRLSSEVVTCVETNDNNDDQSTACRAVKGNVRVSDAPNIFQASGSQESLCVTFPEDDSQETIPSHELDIFSRSVNTDQETSQDVIKTTSDIANLTTIWSAWYHFPNSSPLSEESNKSGSLNQTGSISTNKTKQNQIDNYQPYIDELSHEIEIIQADLRDPQCSKDRDEMESRIQILKKEVQSLRRERRMYKLKQLFSW
jgi:hypothetical protein